MGTNRSLSKSPLALTREALRAARKALPTYSGPDSRHDFTQAQLFAILTLRKFMDLDYRGIVQYLHEWSDLREVLGLKKVPHYSTLCYAEARLLKGGPSSDSCEACSSAPAPRGVYATGPTPRRTRRGSSRTTPVSTTATDAPAIPRRT